VAGPRKRCNALKGSMKDCEFIDQISDYQLLKKYAA
jgi:hypothetical protein